MVAAWVRRQFGGVGITQYRPGPHLSAVQEHFRGHALLCIDVSSSMAGAPLHGAVAGGLDFLSEAHEARYDCGLVLWNDGVVAHLATTEPLAAVRLRLRNAVSGGGTALTPALKVAVDELGPLRGDRVVCVFSDGDIGDVAGAERLAAQARALGIRFVVRGLGASVSSRLAAVLTPEAEHESQRVDDVQDLRRGIASMAADLRRVR